MAEESRIDEALGQVRQAIEGGDVAAARRAIGRLETLAPDEPRTLLARAELESASGQGEAARDAYRAVLEREPDDESAWLAHANLAELWAEAGDAPRALEHARAAIELDEEQPDAYLAAARAYMMLKQPNNALPMLDEALELDEFLNPALMLRAGLYTARRSYGDALNDLARAVDNEPEAVEPYIATARVAIQVGDLVLATNTIDEGLEQVPEAARAPLHIERARLDLFEGERSAAIERLAPLVAVAEAPTPLLLLQAQLILEEDSAGALALFERVLEREPNEPAALLGRARALLRLGRAAAADERLEALLEREPGVEPLLDLADLLVEMGEPERAIVAATAAYRSAPDHPTAALALAELLLDLDRPVEALPYLDRAVDQAPADEERLIARSRALLATGRATLATRDAERALELDAEDPEAHLALAAAWVALGYDAAAAQAVERALMLDPTVGPYIAEGARLMAGAGEQEQARLLWQRYLELPADEQVDALVDEARAALRDDDSPDGTHPEGRL